MKNGKNRVLEYAAFFESNEHGGYTVTVPSLPGLVTEGKDLNHARTRGFSLTLVLSFCCTATAQDHRSSPKAPKQPLLITIDVADANVKAGSGISVNVSIANKSRHPISLGWRSWIDGELVVRDSQGNESLTDLERCLRARWACNSSSNPWGPCPTEDKQCGAIIRLPMGGGFQPLRKPPPLDPGKSYSRPADVDRTSYDLTRPGEYTIQWQGQCLCSKTLLTSNTITLTVIP